MVKEEDFVGRGDLCIKTIDKTVKNKFKWEWLQEKLDGGGYFSDIFRKLKEPGFVYCTTCTDRINYGSSGKKALLAHVKRPSHLKKQKEKKADSLTQPPLAAMFQKLKSLEEGKSPSSISSLPYGAPENVVEQLPAVGGSTSADQSSLPRLVSMADRQSHQEALICTFIAEHSLSLSLAPHLVSLCQELSRDHQALQGLKLERTSATCKLKEGVSGVLRKRLVSHMKESPFSVNVDESTLKSNKARVLNILVCYFDEQIGKSVTHLYASLEMTIVNAETVFTTVVDQFKDDDIPFEKNLVSVLSDSAAYMRGEKNGFQKKMKEVVPNMLDIDGDVCHHLHNVVKMFTSHLDPDNFLQRLLGDVYRDFSFSTDLRDDLCQISNLLEEPTLLPIEFAGHRWMSVMDATARLLKIWDQLTIFYFAWVPQDQKEEKSKLVTNVLKKLPQRKRTLIYSILRRLKMKNLTKLGKARKARIANKIFSQRSETLFLANVVRFVSPLFKYCILALEQNVPQVHKLYDRILEAMTQFLACYIRPEILNAPRCSIKSIDLSKEDNYLSAKQITVGGEATQVLQTMPETDKKKMLLRVKKAFTATGCYMRSKLPLENKLIITLSSLDPIARKYTTTKSMMRQLNHLVHLPESDEFLLQLNSYHVDNDLPAAEDSDKLDLDVFWSAVIKKYPSMSQLIKVCLSIFTGPKVEQSFSLLSYVLDARSNRMAISTAEAYQRVKYVLLAEKKNSVEYFHRADVKFSPVDQALCHHMQTARTRATHRTQKAAEKKTNTNSQSEADAERHFSLGRPEMRRNAEIFCKSAKRFKKTL